MTQAEYNVDAALNARILNRLGLTEGEVEIREEHWDDGFCETCSYPEEGFSVHVNGELVWPARNYLDVWGGRWYADSQGWVSKGRLSAWGEFDAWLNGKDTWDIDDDE